MNILHFNDELVFNNLNEEDKFKVSLMLILGHSLPFSLFRYHDYTV